MGMYTSMVVSAQLKKSTPESVVSMLKALAEDDVHIRKFLGGCAIRNPLLDCSAGYPDGLVEITVPKCKGNGVNVSIISSLKNYGKEIQLFLEWLKPHVEMGHGLAGWWAIVTYEEQGVPTIYYLDPGELP